jgi:hypothetical protein
MKDGTKVKFTSNDDPNIPKGSEGNIVNVWGDNFVTVDFGPKVGEWTINGFEIKEVA